MEMADRITAASPSRRLLKIGWAWVGTGFQEGLVVHLLGVRIYPEKKCIATNLVYSCSPYSYDKGGNPLA